MIEERRAVRAGSNSETPDHPTLRRSQRAGETPVAPAVTNTSAVASRSYLTAMATIRPREDHLAFSLGTLGHTDASVHSGRRAPALPSGAKPPHNIGDRWCGISQA
jgi:hypothetical protein